MPTRSLSVRTASGRPPTAAELARREQLIEATIGLVAEVGWTGFTIQRVADAVGVTKAAVIYHVGSREQLVRAAYQRVIDAFIGAVTERVATAEDAVQVVEFTLRAQLEYFREHPDHARVIVEALGSDLGIEDSPSAPERRDALAGLILAARGGGDAESAGVLAVLLNGALDGAVAASLTDPSFDLAAAEEELIALLHAGLGRKV
jgi:AcrR family transcriptional regulator